MKKHLIKLLAGMLAVFALTTAVGCTEVGLNSNSSGTVTTATETTSAETTEPQTTDSASATIPSPDSATIESAASSESTSGTETTSESTTTAAASDNSDLQGTASSLFGALNYIEQIGSGNLPKDESKTYTSNQYGADYEAVSGTQFSSTADLQSYMESYLTQPLILSRYSNLLSIYGSSSPLYIDVDGALYGKVYATSGGFAWTTQTPTVTDVTDTSFTATMQYDDFGSTDDCVIVAALENGTWKISSVSFDGQTY